MRIGIFENIMTPGGHEVDFDRIIAEEFKALGHEVTFYAPEGFKFSLSSFTEEINYGVPIHTLKGEIVSYAGVKGIKKIWRALKREVRRLGWYRELLEIARSGKTDALIVPTSTYRYLRAITLSDLKNSPVPVIFILHGINPTEAPKFLKAVDKLKKYPNIRPTVLTFTDSIFGEQRENIRFIPPPSYTPRDITWQPTVTKKYINEPLILGFFGQFRREKKLEDFLKVYLKGNYTRPVELFVQGSTMHPEDADRFEEIIKIYGKEKGLKFLHKGLVGKEWQEALSKIDTLVMPYSAPRYRYHWGGMLFTAIGYHKPVITSDDMNPEVFEKFHIGELFKSGDLMSLKETFENFINNYDKRLDTYALELQKASQEYSPSIFANRLIKIFKE